MIRFVVPGEPQGKGRARVGRIGQHVRMFTPAKTAAYEGLVAHAAQSAMSGRALLVGACRIDLDVVCTVPASWSKRKQSEALHGLIRPTKKPDADNVLKAVCDGINGVVWADDTQAVDVTLRKRYGPVPGVWVFVAEVQAFPLLQEVEAA
ncbi:MAG: RusA family crossover junction endodeoxyribonuclease [Rubrivivax sp.]|nr:RusA family crossover junction endodeoxyribonuclease [Rubrivivax sp.]